MLCSLAGVPLDVKGCLFPFILNLVANQALKHN